MERDLLKTAAAFWLAEHPEDDAMRRAFHQLTRLDRNRSPAIG